MKREVTLVVARERKEVIVLDKGNPSSNINFYLYLSAYLQMSRRK